MFKHNSLLQGLHVGTRKAQQTFLRRWMRGTCYISSFTLTADEPLAIKVRRVFHLEDFVRHLGMMMLVGPPL